MKIKISVLIISVFFITYLITGYSNLPSNINLREGKMYSFNISYPFSAVLYPESEICINDKYITTEYSANKSFTIGGNESSANIKLNVAGITLKNINLKINKDEKVYAVGKSFGICAESEGIMVLATGAVRAADGNEYEPAKNVLKQGDIITKINDVHINSKDDLIQEASKSEINELTVMRGGKEYNFNVKAVKSKDDNKYKLGLWIRDSTQGIGTVTYYNKNNNRFGALGHPITDIDTDKIISINRGELLKTNISEHKKGEKGNPGALIGSVDFNSSVGIIDKNINEGIYGYITDKSYIESLKCTEYKIGYSADVKVGEAYILANTDGNNINKYTINIEAINRFDDDSNKNFVIKVTDKKLLEETGGIVQGMSGCPIIQDGKLIGAVTHVFVKNPQKGYGIFIENMIDN